MMIKLTAFIASYFCLGTVAAETAPAPIGAPVRGEACCNSRCQIERKIRMPLVKPQQRGPTPVIYPPESYLGAPFDLLAHLPLEPWPDWS